MTTSADFVITELADSRWASLQTGHGFSAEITRPEAEILP
jgi:hypothetical protein